MGISTVLDRGPRHTHHGARRAMAKAAPTEHVLICRGCRFDRWMVNGDSDSDARQVTGHDADGWCDCCGQRRGDLAVFAVAVRP